MTSIQNKIILTGIKPSGSPHLGNYLGAMRPSIEMQNQYQQSIYFIADFHSLTTIRNAKLHQEYIYGVALDWLALGLNPDKTVFFRQSDNPYHTELSWILSCITPMGLMERAHAWKDAINNKLKEENVGLFTYPILMAADILLYQADIIPVGKDQKQHVEIARDLAIKFNNTFGDTFKLPSEYTPPEIASIPGIDGVHKMSKSYNNTIMIFAEEKELKKQIMSIKTDSTPVEDSKDPDKDLVFQFYSLIANSSDIDNLRDKYQGGNFGYGEAKKILFEAFLDYFQNARQKRIELANNLRYVKDVLSEGAKNSLKISEKTIENVRQKVGLKF